MEGFIDDRLHSRSLHTASPASRGSDAIQAKGLKQTDGQGSALEGHEEEPKRSRRRTRTRTS